MRQRADVLPGHQLNALDRRKRGTTIGATLVAGATGLGLGATLVIVASHSSAQASLSLAPGANGANVGEAA